MRSKLILRIEVPNCPQIKEAVKRLTDLKVVREDELVDLEDRRERMQADLDDRVR